MAARPDGSRLLFSQRAALDAAGVPTAAPNGAPVSDGWRAKWAAEALVRSWAREKALAAELKALKAELADEGDPRGALSPAWKWYPDEPGSAAGAWVRKEGGRYLRAARWPDGRWFWEVCSGPVVEIDQGRATGGLQGMELAEEAYSRRPAGRK